MSQATTIEWTDATWNPIRGCSRVSEGCRNCYAERIAARFSYKGAPYEGLARIENVQREDGSTLTAKPHWTGEVRLIEKTLLEPLKWKSPRRVFVNSMSDLFHEKVPAEWVHRILAIMALCPRHTFQILTKRPERMLEIMGYHSLEVQSSLAIYRTGLTDAEIQEIGMVKIMGTIYMTTQTVKTNEKS